MSNATIRHFLSSFDVLLPADIEEFVSFTQLESLKKNDLFTDMGTVENRIGFVRSGILRSYYYADNADEITYCILFPGVLVAAYSSFITEKPTEECIQAMTDVELLTIRKTDLLRLVEENIRWIRFMQIMAERQYVEQERRIFELQRSSALDRYIKLLADRSDYVQHIPQRYLASYLGITQRHLSRIRGQLAK